MTFASEQLYKGYLRRNMPTIVTKVKVREVVPHLPCLTDHDRVGTPPPAPSLSETLAGLTVGGALVFPRRRRRRTSRPSARRTGTTTAWCCCWTVWRGGTTGRSSSSPRWRPATTWRWPRRCSGSTTPLGPPGVSACPGGSSPERVPKQALASGRGPHWQTNRRCHIICTETSTCSIYGCFNTTNFPLRESIMFILF